MSATPCPCGRADVEHTPFGDASDCPWQRLDEAKRVASVYDAKLGEAMVVRRSAIDALFKASTEYADATYLEGVAQAEADEAWKNCDAVADAMVAAGLPDPRQQGEP